MTRLTVLLIIAACNGGDGTLEEVQETSTINAGDRQETPRAEEDPSEGRAVLPHDPSPAPEFSVALRDGALLLRAHNAVSLRRSVEGQALTLSRDCDPDPSCLHLVHGSQFEVTCANIEAGHTLHFESCAPAGTQPHRREVELSEDFVRAE